MIKDSHGRVITYLRLAVTDRCNLRCTYCMPKEGLDWLRHAELMTNDELLRLCSLFVSMGIAKIRITGGEPFMRKDFLPLLNALSQIPGLGELSLTTNGLQAASYAGDLRKAGVRAVNLSLDTLDQERFARITRRDELAKVLSSLQALLDQGIAVKINAVVMESHNLADIIPLVRLTESLPVGVRFIEEMPFNGGGQAASLNWDHIRIRDHIRDHFPSVVKVADPPHATAYHYQIPGHQGDIGIIAAYTRSFCGNCNRLRLTPDGTLKTCLYGKGKLNVKKALRAGQTDPELEAAIRQAISEKPENGWEAERVRQEPARESMASIGG